MQAKTGDWLVIKGVNVGRPERRGLITDVRSDDGSPPYIVHWLDSEKESTVFPGPDAVIVTAADQQSADSRARHRFDAVQSEIRRNSS